jgi:hypothetical protein
MRSDPSVYSFIILPNQTPNDIGWTEDQFIVAKSTVPSQS